MNIHRKLTASEILKCVTIPLLVYFIQVEKETPVLLAAIKWIHYFLFRKIYYLRFLVKADNQIVTIICFVAFLALSIIKHH